MVSAMSLAGFDTAATENFSDAVVNRPEVRSLFDRVIVQLDERPIAFSSDVSVVTASGATFRASGRPADLVGDERRSALEAKFDALARPVIGARSSSDLLASVKAVDHCTDVASVTALACPQPGQPSCAAALA
jgi:hypothetical protein